MPALLLRGSESIAGAGRGGKGGMRARRLYRGAGGVRQRAANPKSCARSRQAGLLSSISLSFHARFHFLSRFARVIALLQGFVLLEPDDGFCCAALRKAFEQAFAMLMDASDEVRSDADVKRPVAFGCEDVDAWLKVACHGTSLPSHNRCVIPAKAGTQKANGCQSQTGSPPARG